MIEKLPPVGEDAFKDGFLSRKFGQKIIDRQNRPWKVMLPPNYGTGKVMESEEDMVLDLTLMDKNADTKVMHPWQAYITESAPNSVKLKVNPYSCLMMGQSAHNEFSALSWDDEIVVTDHEDEFTHTGSSQVIYIEIGFNNDKMVISGAGAPTLIGGSRWGNFPEYQNVADTAIPYTGGWNLRQLIAYWVATSGDMPKDALFGGSYFTLRCPTTTHLKESIVRGFYGGSRYDIRDYPAIVPWYGCEPGSF